MVIQALQDHLRKMERKLLLFLEEFQKGILPYDEAFAYVEWWCAYASYGNTHKMRMKLAGKLREEFPSCIADVEIDRWLKSTF